MFVIVRASPMNTRSFAYYYNRLWQWDPEQRRVKEYSKSNYGELPVSTLVCARMVCFCDVWCTSNTSMVYIIWNTAIPYNTKRLKNIKFSPYLWFTLPPQQSPLVSWLFSAIPIPCLKILFFNILVCRGVYRIYKRGFPSVGCIHTYNTQAGCEAPWACEACFI